MARDINSLESNPMMKQQSLKLPFALLITAFFSLCTGVIFNLLLNGKADHQFLKSIATLARMGVDCKTPQKSALFNPLNPVYSGQNINAVLYDSNGKLVAKNWPSGEQVSVPKTLIEMRLRYLRSLTLASFVFEGAWVKLNNICEKGWILYVNDPNNNLFAQHVYRRIKTVFLATCASFIIFFLSLWLYLSAKSREATTVLREFSKGHLDVRISVRSWEKSFDLLLEFNRMAEQVADLFTKVQNLEMSRSQLISELAHDTRTPIASLLSALDTLGEFSDSMSHEQKERLIENMRADLNYFARLVEDLFLLSEIDSKSYLNRQEPVNIVGISEKSWDAIFHDGFGDLNCKLVFHEGLKKDHTLVGDLVLLQRMLRNLLENARRYAISWVEMKVTTAGEKWSIMISNDSKPMNSDELKEWGHKRKKRIIRASGSHLHTSLGLGSSIAKRIAEVHGGSIEINQEKRDEYLAIISVSITI